MYPVLFRIGDFEITSFGVMVAVGALVGLWILHRELRRSALPPDALDAAIAGVVGGLAGAKLLWVLEHLHEEPVLELLLSRGGMSCLVASWAGYLPASRLCTGSDCLRSPSWPLRLPLWPSDT
jgi:prolipoprotein diacylglyceryltransferase